MVSKLINVDEAKIKIEKKESVIVDVRTPAEFESKHIKGSYNVPLDKISEFKEQLSKYKGNFIVVCRTGNRAKMACANMSAINQKHSFILDGGITSWEQHGYDLEIGESKWELERQVRLVAGTLIVIGFILGWFFSKYFFILSGFVGAGLAFAAITNTCAMGMIIAKLPYNNPKSNTKLIVHKLLNF